MFYPNKIKNILPNDVVLEIGPGSNPFHRSDVLLELEYENEQDRASQFGHTEKLISEKKIVYYKGKEFPFANNSFDYVICSHVLEHIPDVSFFLSEIFRIAKKGYFEYPLITYDYLYNFDVHLNFLKFNGTKMYLLKKENTSLNEFKPLNAFFLKTLNLGYGDFLGGLPDAFFEGFEWNKPFELELNSNLTNFLSTELMTKKLLPDNNPSIKSSIKQLALALKHRLKF